MQADSLHPEVQAVLERVESIDLLPLHRYGPDGARELIAEVRVDVEDPPVGDVTDRLAPEHPFRAAVEDAAGDLRTAFD